MMYRLTIIMAYLGTGLLLNAIMTLGIALWHGDPRPAQGQAEGMLSSTGSDWLWCRRFRTLGWELVVWDVWPAEPVLQRTRAFEHFKPPTWSRVPCEYEARSLSRSGLREIWDEYAAGFPMKVVHCWRLRTAQTNPEPAFVLAKDRFLPLQPIWLGLVSNTILFASLVWTGRCVTVALIRSRRRAHGLCPTCSYATGASARCAECGTYLGIQDRDRIQREPL